MVRAAGHWTDAMEALRYAWEVTLCRGHVGDIWHPYWEHIFQNDLCLLQYLRTQVFQGARSRQKGANARVRRKPRFGATQKIGQVWDALWKDVFAGRTLVVSQEHPGLEEVVTGKHGTDTGGKPRPGVFSAPVNAVDKMNPDRSVAAAIRVVTDSRGPNATGDLRNRPPALAPRHREVGRSCLWWRRRCPGIPIYLIKLDVDAAFKKVYLWVPDMGRSAFDIPEPRWRWW